MELNPQEKEKILQLLKVRFGRHMHRHQGLEWEAIALKLNANPGKLWTLNEMEKTGGEPDVVDYARETGEYFFYDCSTESPSGRRSACYDRAAQESRKKYKPENNVMDLAAAMGIDILTEAEYRKLQQHGNFDTKTSSWIRTPPEIRKLGGALFGDFRYGQVFIYHNGAESYYAARGFRGALRV
jgi:hypothetical protein